MQVPFEEWIALLSRDYLEGYVRDGGAAVRFAVASEAEMAGRIQDRVAEAAAARGYLVARVDAAHVRVHLMQNLFFEVAAQVPWEELARDIVSRCYAESGMVVPGEDLGIASVAEHNGVDPALIRMDLRRFLEGILFRSHELAKDFRYAVLWLCWAQMAGGIGTEVILEWLTGRLRLISAMKPLLIFRKIDRHNARAMLSSLGAWARLAGRPGLVLLLDVRQLARARRADVAPETHHYSLTAAMDAYEVLRQLIDSTDDLTGFLCVVVAEPALFEDERRGVKAYKALHERIWPDVRLRRRANPLSAMASLA